MTARDLQSQIDDYLALRRSLGFQLEMQDGCWRTSPATPEGLATAVL